MDKTFIAKKELSDQDWKTQLVRGYKNIPEGAEIYFEKLITNCYGKFAQVEYNGILYYVHPWDIEPAGWSHDALDPLYREWWK